MNHANKEVYNIGSFRADVACRLGRMSEAEYRIRFHLALCLLALLAPRLSGCREKVASSPSADSAPEATSPRPSAAIPTRNDGPDEEDSFRVQASEMEAKLRKNLSDITAQLTQKPEDDELLMRRANLYGKLRSFVDVRGKIDLKSKAIGDFERVNRLAGRAGSAEALVGIARTYLTFYEIPKASDYLERARAVDPRDAGVRIESVFLEGIITNNWEPALSKLQLILKEPGMPKNPRLWDRIGFARYSLKQYSEAREAYRKAIEIEPEVIERWTNIALTFAEEGEVDQAAKYYNRVRSVDSTNQFAINNYALSLIKSGDIKKSEEAVQLLQQMLSTGPGFAAAWNNLGNGFTNLKRYQEAIDAYQQAIWLVPSWADAYHNMALTYAKWSRQELAITAFQEAIRCGPDSSGLHYDLAISLNALGKREDAALELKKAGELDPKDARIWTNLGAVYSDMGELDEAVTYTQRALDIDPKHVSAVANRGVIEMRRKQHAKAIPYLMRAIELDPSSRLNLNNLNIASLYSGVIDEVEKFYEKLLTENPKRNAVRFYRAGLDFELGQFDQAVNGFAQVIRADPDFSSARLQKGLAHIGQGLLQEALPDLEAYIATRPENCYGYIYSWVVYLRDGDLKRAQGIGRTGLSACNKDKWGVALLQYAIGEQNQEQLIKKANTNEKKCEANFVVAERVRADKGASHAADWYRKCVETGMKEYFEYALCNSALASGN